MSLLEKRIKRFKIPACPYEPVFDRIVVYQVPEEAATRETYAKGGLIVKPDAIKSSQEKKTARGILIAAGLQAMDELRGHGVDLGHLVWVARLSPWMHTVDVSSSGADVQMMFLRSSDVVGSEDLRDLRVSGELKVHAGDDGRHGFVFGKGQIPRFDPPTNLE